MMCSVKEPAVPKRSTPWGQAEEHLFQECLGLLVSPNVNLCGRKIDYYYFHFFFMGKTKEKESWLEALLKDGTPAPATKCLFHRSSILSNTTHKYTRMNFLCLVLSQEDLIGLRVQILFTSKFYDTRNFHTQYPTLKFSLFWGCVVIFQYGRLFGRFFFGAGGVGSWK
jgi:hypothetical protein